MADTDDERIDELEALSAIYQELVIDPKDPFVFDLDIVVAPSEPVTLLLDNQIAALKVKDLAPPKSPRRPITLSYLPSIHLTARFPGKYPAEVPPDFKLSTSIDWISEDKLSELEQNGREIWESYGHAAVGYDFINALEEAAQDLFGLGNTLLVSEEDMNALVAYDKEARHRVFLNSSFDCGICLYSKSGKDCFQLSCGDVFCRQCLQDFFTSAITEGDTSNIACPSYECKAHASAPPGANGSKKARGLKPSELLEIPLKVETVKRYVEIKRKKKIEADKEKTIYCPRQWCQGFVRSTKYPPIRDLDDIIAYDNIVSDPNAEADAKKPDEDPRLVICEKCKFAFCRTCLRGWHGSFVHCRPRDASELTEEEQATYNYIAENTRPCAYCSASVQKTYGCNHMTCSLCHTHFCYLCGAWLPGNNPYKHFNLEGAPCFRRLFEGEENNEEIPPEVFEDGDDDEEDRNLMVFD